MPLNVGSRLGHYDVTALIGEGGMGQVCQATDTKLNRQVALKILPEAFASDPDRLARFQREAQVLASLNHPGIAAIYGIEEQDDTRALVLELVEGPTLADRIAQGPIPVDEALPIARQIAEALEAAHEAGVIHRDLKPANIKVRDDGTVKVLDFGLAKALDTAPEGDPSQSPTLTAAATQMGVIMGTAAYMSPEQARGRVVDKRTDIWAFGAVVYEMLMGRRAFEGEDVSVTLANVINRPPDWERMPSDLSPSLKAYMQRCLEKEPNQRVADMQDVRLAMEGAFETTVGTSSEPVAADRPKVWQRPVAIVAMVLVAVALGRFSVGTPPPESAPQVTRLGVSAPPSAPSNGASLAISPDGRRVVYSTGTPPQLYVRALDEPVGTLLTDGDGANSPFFSPDGDWVGFKEGPGNVVGTLKKVPVLGGPSVVITELDTQFAGGSWGADGTIIFGTFGAGGLFRVTADGGEPERLTTAEPPERHNSPEILPGGKAVLFTVRNDEIENSRIALLNLETSEQTSLIQGAMKGRYAATGHIVYDTGGTLRAVPFDLDRLSVTGNPIPVLEGLGMSRGTASFGLSDNGSLVYVPAGPTVPPRFGWVTRAGQMTDVIEDTEEAAVKWPRLSPDGTRVVFGRGGDIYIRDLESGLDTVVSADPVHDAYPAWTPEGETVTYASLRAGLYDLYSKPADGSGEAELLVETGNTKQTGSWHPDGRTHVYYEVSGGDTARDIWTVSPGGDPTPFLATPFNEKVPRLSPDGRWLAYLSDQAGEYRLYVQPFPEGGGAVPISAAQAIEPVWSRDGRELFYRDGNRMLVAQVVAEPTFTAGGVTELFDESYAINSNQSGAANYDVSPDGQRFLMSTGPPDNTATVMLVQNWFEELKRLVPID